MASRPSIIFEKVSIDGEHDVRMTSVQQLLNHVASLELFTSSFPLPSEPMQVSTHLLPCHVLESITMREDFQVERGEQQGRMSLPITLSLNNEELSYNSELAKYEFVNDVNFSFERVRELEIELCEPEELKRIVKIIPDLTNLHCFNTSRGKWILNHIRNLCEAFTESAKTLQVVSIPLELREEESYREFFDLNLTKYAQKVEIFTKTPKFNLLEAMQNTGRHTRAKEVHQLYQIQGITYENETTKFQLKDKKSGNSLRIEYDESS